MQPHVYAHFGNKTIDVTTSEEFHMEGEGATDHAFQGLPAIGQGIAVVWSRTSEREGYLMHFGAVVASGTDAHGNPVVCITDVNEIHDRGIVMTALDPSNTRTIGSVDAFRGHDYADPGFSIGLLTTDP